MANENLPPAVISNLMRELQSLAKFAGVSGISVRLPDDRLTTIHAEIHGPEETPYFGGVFHCKLVLGADYPTQPPKAVFATKIFHPNVNSDGMICVSALKKDWQPTQGLRHTLAVIRCLLIQPNPESALNEEAGRMLLEDYDEYASRARLFTKIYAAPKPANDGSKVATAVILEPGLQKKQKRSIKRL